MDDKDMHFYMRSVPMFSGGNDGGNIDTPSKHSVVTVDAGGDDVPEFLPVGGEGSAGVV